MRSKSRRINFIKANVDAIDFSSQTVSCVPAFEDDEETRKLRFELTYDFLILAPGCVPNTFGTPGVQEHALFMKNVSDAMAVRKLLFDLLEKASLPSCSQERKKELLHIAIVGGGPTGVEMTAELDDLAHHELVDLYPEVAPLIQISIYDVAPNILAAYDQKLYQYANDQLVRRHIAVETNSHIERVDKDAFYTREKGKVPYGMLVWATGNKAVPLVEELLVRKTEKGLVRILTDNHLRVFKASKGDEILDNVFALGDAADIDGASLPTTAEVAVQKAKYLVEFFNDRSSAPSVAFAYQQKQLVSYIGSHDGVIAGKGENEGWTGKSAWLAWRSGSILWTRSWRNRTVIVLTWLINSIFGKEIARM